MGLGKNSRPGKRSSSSSSSSSFSTVSTVVFVVFCVIGVYMLSSSSLVPTSSLAASTSSRLARFQETRDVEASEKPLIEEVVEEKQETEENRSRETVSESGGGDGGDNQEEQEAEKGEEKQMKREESEDKKEQSGHKEDEIGGGEKMEETRAGNQEQTEGIERKEETHERNQEQRGEIESGKSKEETHEAPQQEAGNESEKSQSEERKGEESIISEQITEAEAEKKDGDDKKPEISEEESSEERRQASQGRGEKVEDPNPSESLLSEGVRSESSQRDGSWSTQADHSENEKERRKEEESSNIASDGYVWELCNTTAGPDYIPCLDNEKAIMLLRTRKHYEHRERHCPEEPPTCLVPIPEGYKQSIQWPKSRDKIWYHNVPHTSLAEVKGHQNWVKVSGEFLTFPGGGTQFIHGALHYIDFIEKAVPKIAWGKRTRVILDVGCGVASFGGFLFDKDVLAMSFAPKDEHEAQVQFALERGIPAISAVMGTQRLPFPSKVFDIVHCARCRVPWHVEGGALLLELNRVLRPGGYFVWSATPVYQKLEEDVEIWEAMKSLTASMCWDLVTIKKDKLNSAGAAIYRKPTSNDCYNKRKHMEPPMCNEDDDPNAAWHVPLQSCMHKVPVDSSEQGSQWPKQWPQRLQVPPLWLNSSQTGVYGKSAPADFISDYEHWKRVVSKSYLSGLGISWSDVRNVMDMRAVYGGFAAALRDLKVWVMNVVNVDTPDTLPIIYERGLFGIYHDWCESFSTYPRTYDLLHADQLFSGLKKRCNLVAVIAEVDRILRPGGKLIVRDESSTISEVESLLKSLHWEIRLTFSKDQAGILSAQKTDWRPTTFSDSSI